MPSSAKPEIMITYRCEKRRCMTLAPTLSEAKKSLSCVTCADEKLSSGKCYGPKILDGPEASRSDEPKPKKKSEPKEEAISTPTPETEPEPVNVLDSDDILGITPEIDEAIRDALADVSEEVTRRYASEIRIALAKRCGWDEIAGIFRGYGLRVKADALRNAVKTS